MTKWSLMEKKQVAIFAAVAFGVPFLAAIVMAIGFYAGTDISAFPNAQMFYPAAGVMLAMLITRKGDPMLPRKFYIGFLVLTALMLVCSLGSVLMPGVIWMQLVNALIILGSLVCWVLYFLDSKEKRTAYGLRRTGQCRWGALLYVALFLVLYFVRVLAPSLLAGQSFSELGLDANALVVLAVIVPNFFLTFTAFFGEEYGWRGFLQPLLQKRFGARVGVLVLGVVWGLWHLPLNFLFYSPDTPLQSVTTQLITCVTYSIFFAWAYVRTQNIWVPTLIHYFNNNLILMFADPSAIGGQTIAWTDVLILLVTGAILFAWPMLTKTFRSPAGARLTLPLPVPPTQDAAAQQSAPSQP